MVDSDQLKVIIIEDNTIHADLLELHLNDCGYDVAGVFETGEKALAEVVELDPDLALMDINLKGLKNGVDTAQEIGELLNIPIIYTTSQTEATVLSKAAQTGPTDILIKPIVFEQLQASIILALSKTPKSSRKAISKYTISKGHFVFKDGHMYERTPLDNLIFVEGSGNYFTLHLTERKVTLKGTLSELELELPTDNFFRINRSTIIALNKVRSFNAKRIVLETDHEFKISKTSSEDILNKLMS